MQCSTYNNKKLRFMFLMACITLIALFFMTNYYSKFIYGGTLKGVALVPAKRYPVLIRYNANEEFFGTQDNIVNEVNYEWENNKYNLVSGEELVPSRDGCIFKGGC